MHSELDLSEQLINPDEPDPIYDLFAVTVSNMIKLMLLSISYSQEFIVFLYNASINRHVNISLF